MREGDSDWKRGKKRKERQTEVRCHPSRRNCSTTRREYEKEVMKRGGGGGEERERGRGSEWNEESREAKDGKEIRDGMSNLTKVRRLNQWNQLFLSRI